MFCKLISYCLIGSEVLPIEVEVDLSDGLPCFEIVGLPDSSVRESKERTKSAIKNSAYEFPIKHITINLAPADVRKEGSLYDLSIAIGILCASGVIPHSKLNNTVFLGELALSGSLRKVRSLLPILCSTPDTSTTQIIVPYDNLDDLTLLENPNIFYAKSLTEVLHFLLFDTPLYHPLNFSPLLPQPVFDEDFSQIRGQEHVKRALLIAAAGFHNVLLIGPPGSGKTMLAKCLPTILPPLTSKESLELTKLYSLIDGPSPTKRLSTRPFRSPHHTSSLSSLTGGGTKPRPGELSLAHLGVLFLDELLEFSKKTLEVLRQPLESGEITVSRTNISTTYPSRFLFIAATNPCPCGYYPNFKRCNCDIHTVKRYLNKLSGPLLDRIDIQIESTPISPLQLNSGSPKGLSSIELAKKVLSASQIQKKRFENDTINTNSQMNGDHINKYCLLTPSAHQILDEWFTLSVGSVRSYHRILKLSRTIADLDASSLITEDHISEAIGYRLLDRKFWS